MCLYVERIRYFFCVMRYTNLLFTYLLTYLLRSPKAIHVLPGEHGGIWGRLGEVGKSGVLEHTNGNRAYL